MGEERKTDHHGFGRRPDGHFDVPEGWTPRRTALVQMLTLPVLVILAIILIGMIAAFSSR